MGSGVGVADGIAVGLTAGSGVRVGAGVGRTGVGEGVTVGTRVALTKVVRGVGDGMGVGSSGVGVQARVVRVRETTATKEVMKLSLRRRGMAFYCRSRESGANATKSIRPRPHHPRHPRQRIATILPVTDQYPKRYSANLSFHLKI